MLLVDNGPFNVATQDQRVRLKFYNLFPLHSIIVSISLNGFKLMINIVLTLLLVKDTI